MTDRFPNYLPGQESGVAGIFHGRKKLGLDQPKKSAILIKSRSVGLELRNRVNKCIFFFEMAIAHCSQVVYIAWLTGRTDAL